MLKCFRRFFCLLWLFCKVNEKSKYLFTQNNTHFFYVQHNALCSTILVFTFRFDADILKSIKYKLKEVCRMIFQQRLAKRIRSCM